MQKQAQKIPPHNIAVCIPSTDQFTADFSMCLAMFAHMTHHRLAFVNTRSSYIPDNRNNAVKMVLEANATLAPENKISHILFLDNDMIFPADILDQLLSREVSIVGGAYPMRTPPHHLCYTPMPEPAPVNDLEEVLGLPTGSMLIDVHVFTQIPQPWFEQKYYFLEDIEPAAEDANELTPFLNVYFTAKPPAEFKFPVSISCDYWFCALCRMAGYKLYLDRQLTTELQHVGQHAFKFQDSFEWRQANVPGAEVVL